MSVRYNVDVLFHIGQDGSAQSSLTSMSGKYNSAVVSEVLSLVKYLGFYDNQLRVESSEAPRPKQHTGMLLYS